MYGKKSVIRWMSLSISSSILSLLFVLFHDQLQSYLQEQIQSQMTLQPGTQMLAHWTEPPLEPELYAYIYNITNPKEFISGTDLKIKVSEIVKSLSYLLLQTSILGIYEEDLACIDALEQEDEHEMLFRSLHRVYGRENRFKGRRKSLPPDTYDPSCPPSPSSSNPLQKFGLMIDFFCGDIRMEADSELSGETQENASLIKRERYVPSNDSFKDLIPLESCFEGVPFYISQPHFYGSSFRYQDQIEGIEEGQKDRHGLFMDLEKTYGGILGLQMRFQLNFKLIRDSAFEIISHLGQEETVLPLIWLQEGYKSLPTLQIVSLHVGLYMPSVLPKGMAFIFGLLSIIFFMSLSVDMPTLLFNNDFEISLKIYKHTYDVIETLNTVKHWFPMTSPESDRVS
ncbi:SCARB1 [Lepeophtheirus salmonis]|uniref:SCARB1 n=1 Tax=Lepeophtheirus salmonis TaxID=72036 RepID=A0A7R8CR34_LEPSM|nr:SCARB1 [Lepeophtheirus salmonis]CAF2901142.1 SCARB1 [Lepeophtheirus salmonis]